MVEKMLNQFQQGSKESFRWDDDLLLVAYLEGKKLKSVMEKRRRKLSTECCYPVLIYLFCQVSHLSCGFCLALE
jgi:hypothetical protein